jgi:DNA polymerase-3 subunit delta
MTAKKSAWLLLGPETGEKDDFIRELVAAAKKSAGGAPEIYKFFIPETPALQIVSLLQNRLLFSDFKVVIVFGAESLPRGDIGLLADYLERPAPDSLLVLCSDETRPSLAKLEERIEAENRKIFWELLDHQKRGWVKTYFTKRGMDVEEEALDFLCEMVENNTRDLKSVCERLALFFGKGAVIRYENIERYIYHGKEENVFTLFAALVRRDFDLALEIIDKMLLSRDEDAVRILSGLSWQLTNLVQFFALLERGVSRDQAFQKLAVKSKRQQQLYSDARGKFGLEELLHCVAVVSRFDALFRAHNQSVHRVLLELLVYDIVKLRPVLKNAVLA